MWWRCRGRARRCGRSEQAYPDDEAAAGAGFGVHVVVSAGYAATQDWPTVVPPIALAGGIGATVVIGAIAGLYPAVRAARLAPTEALSTT